MRRRQFITLLGGAAAAWPMVARGQQTVPVVGSLYGTSAAEWAGPISGFRSGLAETGYFEGRNVRVEYRWAEGHFDRMPAMAADLVACNVAVILVGGNLAGVRAALAATRTIPVVFTTASDPVAAGLGASLNRPGGNATGVTVIAVALGPKKLELLHEMIPAATKVAFLVNPKNSDTAKVERPGVESAARRLGLELVVLHAGTEPEIDDAFSAAAQQKAAGVYVGSDAFLVGRGAQIAALGQRHALATMSPTRNDVLAGQLMSYGPSQAEMYRQAGVYVGRILNGEKPAELPVLQPTKFEFVVNVKTAQALGIDIPAKLLAIADEVIE
jgi:putative tryptophan/tyrosine transport system substrate-binding protein